MFKEVLGENNKENLFGFLEKFEICCVSSNRGNDIGK